MEASKQTKRVRPDKAKAKQFLKAKGNEITVDERIDSAANVVVGLLNVHGVTARDYQIAGGSDGEHAI